MSKKWVVFDFCETLVNLQSADAFIDFATQNERQKWRGFIRKLIGVFGAFKVFALVQKVYPEYSLEKRMRLFLLRGLSVEALERRAQEFVDSVLVEHENKALLRRLMTHQDLGDIIEISSGGLHIYLKYWAKKHGIDLVDATHVEVQKRRVTGFIDGSDCMYEEKVNRLNHALKYTKSREGLFRVVYSDSISDLPLFQWADEAWVVSYEKERNWVKINNFKEIVIGRNNGGLEV
jgi:HAD superfamily hydrolase (TIGR01490 family)